MCHSLPQFVPFALGLLACRRRQEASRGLEGNQSLSQVTLVNCARKWEEKFTGFLRKFVEEPGLENVTVSFSEYCNLLILVELKSRSSIA